MVRKFPKISVILFVVVIILLSILLYDFYTNEEDKGDSQFTINHNEEDYIDNIHISGLSVQKSSMDIGNEDKQGVNFVLSYSLPDEADISSDIEIGLQIEFPDECSKVLGGNMSAISYFTVPNTSEETSYLTYGVYPSNIEKEDLNKLISTQYSFKINIFIDQQIIRELYIENS